MRALPTNVAQFIAAIEARDETAVLALVVTVPTPCTGPDPGPGLSSHYKRPYCPPGAAKGTLIPLFESGACMEGVWIQDYAEHIRNAVSAANSVYSIDYDTVEDEYLIRVRTDRAFTREGVMRYAVGSTGLTSTFFPCRLPASALPPPDQQQSYYARWKPVLKSEGR